MEDINEVFRSQVIDISKKLREEQKKVEFLRHELEMKSREVHALKRCKETTVEYTITHSYKYPSDIVTEPYVQITREVLDLIVKQHIESGTGYEVSKVSYGGEGISNFDVSVCTVYMEMKV